VKGVGFSPQPIVAYQQGQWDAFDRILNYLNTLDEQRPDKGKLYKAIMEMKPNESNNYYR